MAKDNKFPSPANKSPKASSKKAEEKKQEEKQVEGKSMELVQILYTKDNTHALNHYIHLSKGTNHVPKGVWSDSKNHPTIKKLMDDGHIKELSKIDSEEPKEEPTQEEASEETEAGNESGETTKE